MMPYLRKKKLLFIVNDASFFLSHRAPIATQALSKGYDVHVATPTCGAERKIQALGFAFHSIQFDRGGTNPFKDFSTLFHLWKLIRKLSPDVVHLVTIKPVLYGGLVCRLLGVGAVVSAISGLGSVFIAQSLIDRFVRWGVTFLYRIALSHGNQIVIFQNPDDLKLLQDNTGVLASKCRLIKGSGVCLSSYRYIDPPLGRLRVVMASRLLREKGVWEFVEAATILKQQGTAAEFLLAGDVDLGNPSSLTEEDLRNIENQGVVTIVGYQKSLASFFSLSHIVVLPSYREGLPKVLIEAAAVGRPVVTTDVPGCRDAIEPETTGVLVPPRNASLLARAIKRLLDDSVERRSMGERARLLAEREFGLEHVVKTHMEIYRELLGT